MAQTTITLSHLRASDYKGNATDAPRTALNKVLNLLAGALATSYQATSLTVSQDPASATVTLSGVGGTASTGTVTLSNVGGTAATGSVTLSGVGGTAATGTVTLGGGAGNVTVVINGQSLGPVAFNTDDDTTADDLAAAISAQEEFDGFLCQAAAVGPVVTITASNKGTAGNVTLTASRSAGTATASGATLTGGAQGSVGVTVNGTLVTTDTTNLDNDDAATAVAAAIEANGTLGPLLAAEGNGPDVELTWGVKGTVGNAVTLSATTATGTATRSAATFAGGAQGSVTVTVGGTAVVTDTTNLSNDAAATAVAAALDANSTVFALVDASAATNVVTLAAQAKGTAGDAITLTSTSATGTATASGATLGGGGQGSVTVTVNGTAEATNTTNLTDTAAATLIASELSAVAAISALVTATSSGAVVTLTANAAGEVGNTITLTSSTTTGTATSSAAKLSGGTSTTYTL